MQVLAEKLESLGARVATRLGKEVTHIIFQRQRSADAQEQEAEDSELQLLYDKAAKVRLPRRLSRAYIAALLIAILTLSCRQVL